MFGDNDNKIANTSDRKRAKASKMWEEIENPKKFYPAPINTLRKFYTAYREAYMKQMAHGEAPHRYIYFIRHESGRLTQMPNHDSHSLKKQSEKIDEIYKYLHPAERPQIIALFDLENSFEEQIRLGNLEPYEITSWNILKQNPIGFSPKPPRKKISLKTFKSSRNSFIQTAVANQNNFTEAVTPQEHNKAPSFSYYSKGFFLSDALESFDEARREEKGKKEKDLYFLAFENTNGEAIYDSFKENEDIVKIVNDYLGGPGSLKLVMALDTTQKFQSIVPEPAFRMIKNWKAFNQKPLITIEKLQPSFPNHITPGHLYLKFGINVTTDRLRLPPPASDPKNQM